MIETRFDCAASWFSSFVTLNCNCFDSLRECVLLVSSFIILLCQSFWARLFLLWWNWMPKEFYNDWCVSSIEYEFFQGFAVLILFYYFQFESFVRCSGKKHMMNMRTCKPVSNSRRTFRTIIIWSLVFNYRIKTARSPGHRAWVAYSPRLQQLSLEETVVWTADWNSEQQIGVYAAFWGQ